MAIKKSTSTNTPIRRPGPPKGMKEVMPKIAKVIISNAKKSKPVGGLAPKSAKPKTTKKAVTPKPKKTTITPRKRIDVSKMTPAQKQAYYNQPGYDNY